MAELSPRNHFLQITFETILHDNSQDEYVQTMLQSIGDFVADDATWKRLSPEERDETEQLLKVVNEAMEKVVASKAVASNPETGKPKAVSDSHATQTFRGGLINALFRLKGKADAAGK